jgi:hypothetical protein
MFGLAKTLVLFGIKIGMAMLDSALNFHGFVISFLS